MVLVRALAREAHLEVEELLRDTLAHARRLVGHGLAQVTTELLQARHSHR